MFKSFWILVLLCFTGWVLVFLGVALKFPLIIQIMMIIVGLIFSLVSIIGLIKHLLRGNK